MILRSSLFVLFVIALASGVSGCAPRAYSVGGAEHPAALDFIGVSSLSGRHMESGEADFPPNSAGRLPGHDALIAETCDSNLPSGDSPPEIGGALGALVLTAALEKVSENIVAAMRKRLAQELGRYTASYSISRTTPFYRLSDEGQEPELRWNCMRFTQYKPGENGDPGEILFDALVQFRSSDEPGGMADLQLAVRRVYCGRPSVKVEDGESYKVRLAIAAESTWRENNRGFSERIFEHKLAEVTCQSTPDGQFKYFPEGSGEDPDWNAHARLPIIPYSLDASGKPLAGAGDFGLVRFTVQVAESSVPPKTLSRVYEFIKDKEDNLSKLLADQAKKELDI